MSERFVGLMIDNNVFLVGFLMNDIYIFFLKYMINVDGI